ncbi:hypothetical protein RF11_06274 [Thelohanellus kitauei]|uniref:Transcriptional activator protein Pur-alpha n=1 Tax=Thelohanellus kitauei TaxID=669202 RepID=A0A0C2ME49_THEKT|nr:hypothetical protein RF11_06274 [Thelohanellus kitauei]
MHLQPLESNMYRRTPASKCKGIQYRTTPRDLMKKEVSIPGFHTYYLSLRQNKNSRYFVIKDIDNYCGNSRIIVPMDHCQEFLYIIRKIIEFNEEVLSMKMEGKYPKKTGIINTSKMYTEIGRRYYFDVCYRNYELYLKLTYKYDDRKDTLYIYPDVLIAFAKIIEEFQKRYPSLDGEDDIHPKMNRSFNKQRRCSATCSRYSTSTFCPITNGPSSAEFPQNINFQHSSAEPVERETNHGLKVCSDLAQCIITLDYKKYKFEIVEGYNTFMRTTETCGDNKHKTIYIPIECVKKFKDALEEIDVGFSKIRSDGEKGHKS